MNKLLSIIFLIFGLLFLLNLGYSALPTGCVYRDWEFKVQCEFTYGQINMNLDSIYLEYPDYKLINITLNAPEPNNNYKITFNNQNQNNLDITITSKRYEKNFVELIFNNSKNTNISKLSLVNNKTVAVNGKNLTIINQFIPLVISNTKPQTIRFNNLKINDMTISGKNIIELITLSDYNINKITFFYNPILEFNSDKIFGINELIYGSNISSNVPIVINKFNLQNASNLDLNLVLGKNVQNKISIKNVSDSNINLMFLYNISIVDNITNILNVENSRNLIINGFDYNKINTLNLVSPNSMLNITNSQFVSIQGFKLYSDKGIKNNNLNYINLNNSLAIIKNNVFNDVNYPIKSYNSNVMIYSNSFYNVDNIFDTNFGNSSIVFFNNFLKAIDNLYNLTFAPEYILSLDENKSFGPVIDSDNYNCTEQIQPIFYDPRFFDSTNFRDRNIPIYYYDPKTKTNINYIYAPQCLGGNLYANKTILNICGQNCFLFLMEYNNTDKPDLIWDLSLTAKYADNIIDNAPLIFPKVEYQDIIYETSDKYLQMAISIINKKDPYEKTDDVNFQILIRPNDLILKDNALEEFFFGGDKIYHFKSIDIENKKIILDKSVSANAFQEGCDICKKVNGSVIYSFEIVFEDLNFDLTNFDKLKSGDKNFKFSLNYDFDNNSSSCNWVEDYWDKYPYEKNDPELLDLYNNILFCSTQKQSISQLIPLNIEGSAPTIKTPDNNIWIIALLSISIVGIYLFGNRRQSKRKQSI